MHFLLFHQPEPPGGVGQLIDQQWQILVSWLFKWPFHEGRARVLSLCFPRAASVWGEPGSQRVIDREAFVGWMLQLQWPCRRAGWTEGLGGRRGSWRSPRPEWEGLGGQ